MNGIESRIENNHENKPALFLSGVDCVESCDGLTLHDLNNFIRFLEGQRVLLKNHASDEKQKLLFDETVKDEQNV